MKSDVKNQRNIKRFQLSNTKEYPKPISNSPLKKKLSLLNKLKNTYALDESQLIEDFKNENMSKFLHEIVEDLLCEENFKKNSTGNEFKTIKLYNYFSMVYDNLLTDETGINEKFSQLFMKKLVNMIKECISGISKINVLTLLKLFTELIIVNKIYEIKSYIKMVKKIVDKLDDDFCIIFLDYLGCLYEDFKDTEKLIEIENTFKVDYLNEDETSENYNSIRDLITIDDLELIKDFILGFVKEDFIDKYKENIKVIFGKIDIDTEVDDDHMKFEKIIDDYPGEFDFYTKKIDITNNKSESINNPINFIESNIKNLNKIESNLDSIIKGLFESKNDENSILRQILKIGDSHNDAIALLSKIMVNFKEFHIKFTKKIDDTKIKPIFLLFLCEISKFEKFSKKKIIKILENMLKEKKEGIVIKALDSIARYYLCDKDTNYQMRLFLEKLRHHKVGCQNVVKIDINNCISRILGIKTKISSFDDFYSYYFSKNIKESLNTNLILKNDILVILSCKPWLFQDHQYLIRVIVEKNIFEKVFKIAHENVIICAIEELKNKCIEYTRFYSSLLNFTQEKRILKWDNKKTESFYVENIEGFVDNLEKLNIDVVFKTYILLNFVENIKNRMVQSLYLEKLQQLVSLCQNNDLEVSFRNFILSLENNIFDIDKEMSLLSMDWD